jgi:hypothetical protein
MLLWDKVGTMHIAAFRNKMGIVLLRSFFRGDSMDKIVPFTT